ncbi:mammalian cell entry protein [Rhodococcus sp. ACT016]|uniref:mammalian cell entry protein n=1 Tax=Rhodococcus sp. ACT016 TaxID=3134808 RepID=UPI003D2719ED
MPPIRRNTRLNTPQRRPKIAGTADRPGVGAAATSGAVVVEQSPGVIDETTVVVDEPTAALEEAPAVIDEPTAALEEAPAVEESTETPRVAGVEDVEPAASDVAAERGRLSWRLVTVLGAVAVVAAAFAVVAAFRPGAQVSNTAYVDIATTSEVTEATRAALTTLYAYAPDTIDQYPDKARGVLTEKMRSEFDKTVDPTVSAVKQSGTSTAVELSDVGVKVLDRDRAELIVNMTVSAEANGVAQDSASGPLIVQMEKVDGVWLLSDIADQ